MIATNLTPRSYALLYMAVLGSLAVLIASTTTLAANQVESPCEPNVEQWVLEKVAAGVEANLGLCGGSDRVLTADFLVDLLTGSIEDLEIQRKGVGIANGVVVQRLDLGLAEISHETRLAGFRFEDEVDLSGSAFLEELSLEGSQFRSASYFTDMKVGGLANFDNVVFSGAVDFMGADIDGSFQARSATFNDAEQVARFNGIRVRGLLASFQDAKFAGHADFIAADISGQFQAMDAVFNGTANMNSMKVGTAALFNNAVFDSEVSFRVSDIPILNLTGVSWPEAQGSIQLDGMTYQVISAGDKLPEPGDVTRQGQESWKDLLNLADRAIYSRNVYTGLEEFFRSQGEDEIADKFFVANKRRQRREALGGPLDPAWWGSVLLDYLVLFGLSPHRAFGIGAIFVLLGAGVYFDRKKNMEPRNHTPSTGGDETPPEPESGQASSFALEGLWALGYSLDLFLPVIDLQFVSRWRPSGDARFGTARLVYMRIHILVGWILIPIGLLAVTGVFA